MTIWAVSLLTGGASPPQSNCRTALLGIRSLIGPVSLRTIRTFQCSTPQRNIRRKPESSFGENQLLQRSISFSLQPSSHPKILHNLRVRPSHTISDVFSLLKGSSRCFGSDMYDCNPALSKNNFLDEHSKCTFALRSCFQKVPGMRAIHTRFRYGSVGKPLSQAVHINSLAHSSIGTPSWSLVTGNWSLGNTLDEFVELFAYNLIFR